MAGLADDSCPTRIRERRTRTPPYPRQEDELELVALLLILYGIVSIPWLIIPAVALFVLMESADRRPCRERWQQPQSH